jgi:hypothetical protein
MAEYEGYASHMPVLKKILSSVLHIDTILETGMGEFSTRLFVESGAKVTSIEMNGREWYDKMTALLGGHKNWTPVYAADLQNALAIIKEFGYADLVFIDGNGDNRFDQINACYEITDLIVVHDTEEKGYQWEKVKLPKDWEWFNVKDIRPWTAIVTPDKKILDMFK